MRYYDELMELEEDVSTLQKELSDKDNFDLDKFNNAVINLRENAEKLYCVNSYEQLEEK